MGFPFVAVAAAGVSAASSWFGNSAKNEKEKAKAKAFNKEQNHVYKIKRDRSIAETIAGQQMAELNYAWDTAQHEALLFQEKQAASDQAFINDRLIEAATKSLGLNEEAIFDQYVTGEDLRAKQEGMNLKHNQDVMALEATDAARQYMTQIQQNAINQTLQTQQQKKEIDTLLGNMTLKSAEENLLRDIEFVESMSRQGSETARGMERTGGTSTARAQTQNLAKEFGRSFGTIALARQARDMNLSTMNATMQGQYATQLGKYALDSRLAMGNMGSSNQKFKLGAELGINTFRDLTMPGFELAQRQGSRDLSALHIGHTKQMDQLTMPVRDSIKFGPQKALPAFSADFIRPTKMRPPEISTGSMIGSAVTAGISGAMSASYTKAGGGIGFY